MLPFMRIEVVSDTICPWCFIGKRRLERALGQRPDLEIEIEWRPFQLNPDMPREGLDRKSYLSIKFGGADRAQGIYDTIREVGRGEGIDFAFEKIARTPNTVDSHRLIHWSGADDRQDAVVELLFHRYFIDGADIGDRDVLVRLAAEAGMDSRTVEARFANGDDAELVRAQDSRARGMGIAGVPLFIVNGRYRISGAQKPDVLLQAFDLAARADAPSPPDSAGA